MSTDTQSVDLVGDETVVNLVRTMVMAALVGAFAFVSFQNPFAPGIPVTLQVLGVFLAGALLGPWWATASLTLYVVAGALGAPVFAGGGAGIGVILGQTGGYILSYPFAALAVGLAAHGPTGLTSPGDISLVRLVAGMVVATAIIYAFGTVGWAVVNGIGFVEAFVVAGLAFVPAELFKMAATVGIIRSDALSAE